MSPILAIVILAILGIVFIKFGWFTDDAFDEMDEGLRRAQEARRKRDRAIEKLDDWLDRH